MIPYYFNGRNENGNINSAKEMLVDIIDVLQRRIDIKILWALQYEEHRKTNPSIVDITRMLVYQALQINPKALTHGPNPITIVHIREAANESDWMQILKCALEGLSLVFIVLDFDLVNRAVDGNQYRSTRWVRRLIQTVGSDKVKIIVPSPCVSLEHIQRCIFVFPPY